MPGEQGRSVSDVVRAPAQEAAHQAIEEAHRIRLSVDERQRFAEILLNPPEVAAALIRAREVHTRLIEQSR